MYLASSQISMGIGVTHENCHLDYSQDGASCRLLMKRRQPVRVRLESRGTSPEGENGDTGQPEYDCDTGELGGPKAKIQIEGRHCRIKIFFDYRTRLKFDYSSR